MMDKPFSQACENNKAPILRVLQDAFRDTRQVLEIGSGTGQHALYFAQQLAHLSWQPSDVAHYLPGITAWLQDTTLTNIKAPIALDVRDDPWPVQCVDGIFTANSLHIMGKPEVARFFEGVARVLSSGGKLCIYGPFNYQGKYTSQSNAEFDNWLRVQNPISAIRDFEWIEQLAHAAGLTLVEDHAMPANNRLLVWTQVR